MYKCVGFRFANFILNLLKYSTKMKEVGLTETKLFRFRMKFKNGGRGGGEPPELPLDQPLT